MSSVFASKVIPNSSGFFTSSVVELFACPVQVLDVACLDGVPGGLEGIAELFLGRVITKNESADEVGFSSFADWT